MMMISFLLFAILILACSEACIRILGNPHAQGIWDELDFPRNTSKTCSCGIGTMSNWTLFVHSKTKTTAPAPDTWKTCMATIVTSNLVLTSHKCLTLAGSLLHVYDGWKPRPRTASNNGGVIIPLKDIVVSSSLNISAGENFPVEGLIINPNYALTASLLVKTIATNDLVPLVLKNASFTEHPTLRPICLPDYDTSVNLTGQPAQFYGPNELGYQAQLLLHMATPSGEAVRYGDDCGAGKSDDDVKRDRTLCLRYYYEDRCLVSKEDGGALVSSSGDERASSFLIAIATKISSPDEGGAKSGGKIHLTNIFHSVKYIEYQAKLAGSRWCTTPKFHRKEAVSDKLLRRVENLCGPWPWTDFSPPERDESLACECGEKNVGVVGVQELGRVIGGTSATPREFGWTVKLKIDMGGEGDDEVRTCGASLINDRMILSAANCFMHSDYMLRTDNFFVAPDSIRVFLNSHKYDDDPEEMEVRVKALYPHPGHVGGVKRGWVEHDIAVLVLETPLAFNSSGNGLRPVCLPHLGTADMELVGKTGTVVGWGLTSLDSDVKQHASELKRLEKPIKNMSACEEAVHPHKIMDGFICAGTLHPEKDVARGDAGGPLIVLDMEGKWIQVGIVSHGVTKDSKSAALYTNVQKNIQFVDYFANGADVKAKWCKYVATKNKN